jgi:deoxyribodipyrimidine photo-lyase
MTEPKLLVYLMRRDLRVSDNPIFHTLSTQPDHGFTHLLPLYIFPAQQVEVSGFIEGVGTSPYPATRSQVGGFWRCGPFRATFLAQSVWALKESLEKVDSGLCIRVGLIPQVISTILAETKGMKVGAVWMFQEEGVEENREERGVKKACDKAGIDFKLWVDEKYFIDEFVFFPPSMITWLTFDSRDLAPLQDPCDVPNTFTTYRKIMEPLRQAPREILSSNPGGHLPKFPTDNIPPQASPFTIPTFLDTLITALLKPLNEAPLIKDPTPYPVGAKTVHPFKGGEINAHKRVEHLISTGAMSAYKETRNGMLGEDFSSKLSAYLAIGCITARQIHHQMKDFEDGITDRFEDTPGYGEGENEGTKAMRFELLWRDYMRLCTRKHGEKLFKISGFKAKMDSKDKWSSPSRPNLQTMEEVQEIVEHFLNGTTGMGLIDASQRELFHTGYTSNRARQNVASFLSRHLYIDWRLGAEWYESMLVDYDLSSNWGNWQYVAGVGNDPKDDQRVFNPAKQSLDYDPQAKYIKTWVPEAVNLKPPHAYQLWTVPEDLRAEMGLVGLVMVEKPLKKIDFVYGSREAAKRTKARARANEREVRDKADGGHGDAVEAGGAGGGAGDSVASSAGVSAGGWSGGRDRELYERRGRGRGGNAFQPWPQTRGDYRGRGNASSRGNIRGYRTGRGRGSRGSGREARTGMMDKETEAQSESSMPDSK